MPSLDDLPTPITPSVLDADYDGRKPLSVPAIDAAVRSRALVRL